MKRKYLILGGLGLGALALYAYSRKSTQADYTGGLSGGGGGSFDIPNKLIDAAQTALSPLGVLAAVANPIIDAVQATTRTTSVIGSYSPTTTAQAKIIPGSKASPALTQDTPQIQLARALNIRSSYVNPAINYAQAKGQLSTWQGQTGKYDAATGAFINERGQGFSVAPKFITPKTPINDAAQKAKDILQPKKRLF